MQVQYTVLRMDALIGDCEGRTGRQHNLASPGCEGRVRDIQSKSQFRRKCDKLNS